MCAHKVIGMSVIALMCSAVIANTSVMIGPETKVISTSVDGAWPPDCAPRINHGHGLPSSSTEARMREPIDVYEGEWGIAGPIYFTSVTATALVGNNEASDTGGIGDYSAYEVLNVDDDIFEHESLSSREQYETRRVGEGFRLEDL